MTYKRCYKVLKKEREKKNKRKSHRRSWMYTLAWWTHYFSQNEERKTIWAVLSQRNVIKPWPVILQGVNRGKRYSLVSNLRDWRTLWKQSKKILKTRPRKKAECNYCSLSRGNWYSIWKIGLGNNNFFQHSRRNVVSRRGYVIFSMSLTCKITDK